MSVFDLERHVVEFSEVEEVLSSRLHRKALQTKQGELLEPFMRSIVAGEALT